MRPLFSSFSIIFLQYPPHMQPVTFHLHFLLISIIFINEIPINASCLSKAFAIAFSIFLSHNKLNQHPLGCFPPLFIFEYVSHQPWPYIFLHGIFTRVVTKPCPLGEHHPRCSMTPITNKIVENKTYNPCSFITQLIAVFTMTKIET